MRPESIAGAAEGKKELTGFLYQAGGAGIVSKPFKLADLERAIERIFEGGML